ncbi:MAG: 5-(carboxyamino)imidazole ribonucleotide synthase, partial [Acaryochloris sp. SU_5_25]|nr:5-(carboxyamino)imidazole ribonucleotide synthase [Acaryochloris sp. SU_5_25]
MPDFAIAPPSASPSALSTATIHQIGVLGGGQLAWMLTEAAQSLGLELIIQTPNSDDPALRNAHAQGIGASDRAVLAPIADAVATAQLAQRCQVITFENEFVDLQALQKLADQGISFRPSLSSLAPLL